MLELESGIRRTFESMAEISVMCAPISVVWPSALPDQRMCDVTVPNG